jgi:hypothetical protein
MSALFLVRLSVKEKDLPVQRLQPPTGALNAWEYSSLTESPRRIVPPHNTEA